MTLRRWLWRPAEAARGLLHQLFVDRDLVLAWALSVAALPLVDPSSPLGGDDFVWWTTLTLSAAAALRGRALGEGAHPALSPQRSHVGGIAQRVALALTPWTLLAWAELGRGAAGPLEPAVSAVGAAALTLALLGLRALSWREGRTAWAPRSPVSPLVLALAVGALPPAAAWALGRLAAATPEELGGLSLTAGLMGLGFLSTGLFAGRVQHWLQRRAARDASAPWRPTGARLMLALVGPPAGFALGLLAQDAWLERGLGPEQAYIVSLYVLAWARVLWPRPLPLARTVLLHEVVPTGGGDARSEGLAARDFSQVPSGALRVSPLRLRRTRAIHPWVVPVSRPGLSAQGESLLSPWPLPPPPPSLHALGEARFEPDPLLGLARLDEITLRIPAQEEHRGHNLKQDNMTRRVLVLRAFPEGSARDEETPTYAWDDPLPPGSVQRIEPGVREATLRDRDVILIASGGRARLYEVELGAVVTDPFLFELGRAPQLEDYVQVTR